MAIFGDFVRRVFSASRVHHVSDLHPKIIRTKATPPPHMDGLIVFAKWRQCAPHLLMLP